MTNKPQHKPTQTHAGNPNAPIEVWTDDDGNRYAAQQVAADRLLFAVSFKERQPCGYSLTASTPQSGDSYQPGGVRFAVEYALRNYYFDSEATSYKERLELDSAARDQNPIPHRTLAHAISYPERVIISDEQRAELVNLLAPRCRYETRAKLDRRLQYPESLKNYGIFDRVFLTPSLSYCAGQDYPSEIATVRKLIIGG